MSSPSSSRRPALDRFRNRRGATPAAPGATGPTAAKAPTARPGVVTKERRMQAILASVETLPSLPGVVTQVLRLANDANAGARDFETIIRRDQALAAKVLKLVNSPFYGPRYPIASIPQAIVALGMKSLRSVVLAAKTSRLLDRQLTPYGLGDSGLWKHSMSCATLAQGLAKARGADQAAQEVAFVGGLLHDVGKVILAPHVAELQDDFDRAREEARGDVVQAEKAVLGLSHPEAGGLMGRRWDLPAPLIAVIAGHHGTAVDGADPVGLATVRVADDLCNQTGVGLLHGACAPSPYWEEGRATLALPLAGDELRQWGATLIEQLEPVFREAVRA
jgi:putative nucleotidyltransferase with HDIG domain